MRVQYHKSFSKQITKLSPGQLQKIKQALLRFEVNPQDPILRNHPLKGEWAGYRSISAGGDLRVHYRAKGDSVLLVAVGTHSQLYK